jgi:hypothetical protein
MGPWDRSQRAQAAVDCHSRIRTVFETMDPMDIEHDSFAEFRANDDKYLIPRIPVVHKDFFNGWKFYLLSA